LRELLRADGTDQELRELLRADATNQELRELLNAESHYIGKEECVMEKNHQSGEQKKITLKVAIYMRVSRIEQLNMEEQKNILNLKANSIEKGGKS
jgi:hypothetical protein